MIKPLWTVRNIHKLFNGLNVSISSFMLVYTILNLMVFDKEVARKMFFWSQSSVMGNKYALLILPIVGIVLSCVLVYLSTIPKHIKYEINEITKITALKDLKNHRELIIGCNFLLTLSIFFAQLDNLSFAKHIKSFGFIPTIVFIIMLIPFTIYKYIKTKKIYEI